MSTLRISDAPLLPDVDGTEKIPTGGRGDYAISVDQIKDHIFQDVGKELVGLGNVDNTSDLDKPVSTAQQAALNLKADKTYVDTNLNSKADKTNVYTRSETSLALSKKADLVNGVIPENQIPSSFNDVLEFTTENLPIVGESGKIYVTTDTNRTWRWSGNHYVEISNGGVSDSTLKLQTPRKIANVDFDGTQNIDIPHNNLTSRNVENAHTAFSIGTASGENQQDINDYSGAKWRNKAGGYDLNARVVLENGEIVKSTIASNTANPNIDMTGWIPDQYSNYGTTRAKTRSVQNKLKDIPSILDWDADSANDDSARIQKALLDGVDSLFIPPKSSYGVFKVGELELTKSIKLWGVGGQGIDQQGSVIQKASGASYALHFNGLGQSSRPLGGGLFDVTVQGFKAGDVFENADLVKVTRWSYFKSQNTTIQNTSGWGLRLKNVMESTVELNLFRKCGDDNSGIILLDDYIDTQPENCNNIHIEKNTFGFCSGDWIKSTVASNPDIIWINNNKFEFDGQHNINSSAKYVINFGMMARAFIKDNSFTYFKSSLNNYAGVLKMGAGCYGHGVNFEGNNLLECETPWNIQGGRFIAENNEGVNITNDGVNSSKIACDIEPIKRKDLNGNLRNSLIVNKAAMLDKAGFISAHKLTGPIGHDFVADTEALFETCMKVTTTSAPVEIRRLQLSPDLINSGSVLKIRVRAKSGGSATAAIKLNLNGTADAKIGLLSSETATVQYITSAQTTFKDYEWYLTPDQIGAGGLRLLAENPNASLLFDGVYVEVVKSIPYSISWPDIGTLTGGQIKQSTTRDLRVKNYITSFGSVVPNASDSGLIYTVNIDSSNVFRAQVYNANTSSVLPATTNVKLSLNLV